MIQAQTDRDWADLQAEQARITNEMYTEYYTNYFTILATGEIVIGTLGAAIPLVFGGLGEQLEQAAEGPALDILDKDASHIFRAAHGWTDTPANRELLRSIITPANQVFEGVSKHVDTYRALLPDGRQVWAEVWNGIISNGGINADPR